MTEEELGRSCFGWAVCFFLWEGGESLKHRRCYLILIVFIYIVFCTVASAETPADAPKGETKEASTASAETGKAPHSEKLTAGETASLKERITALEAQVGELTEKAEADELEQLVAEAEAEAKAPEAEEKPEERTFLWGALALQKLNPEFSVNADILAALVLDDDLNLYQGVDDRSRIGIREVGFQLQHVLDPYSMFKACINFIPEPEPEVEVEEVYITWFGIVPSLSLSVGRFRQDFGIINRWHGHDLDQTDYPLALTQTLGEGGLNQTGFVLKWFMPPLIAHANELTLAVTNAENETLFSGEFFTVPSTMLHLKNYYDLSDSTYLELGLSGIFGMNNRRGYLDADDELENESWRQTWAAGADLTVQWTPLTRAKYRGVTWRTEGYFVHKETATDPDTVYAGWGEADGDRVSWGVYSYLDVRLNPRWIIGVRGDLTMPTVRTEESIAWDVVPYVTFWQSEFVYLRLEYQHGDNIPYMRPDESIHLLTDNRVLLQIDFAAGPHKHEKY
jgi:hypothetical protein